MNWLAHLFLAEPTPAARVGAVLPDLVQVGALLDLTPELSRIGCRLRRPFDLAAALPVFERHYAAFHSDFAVFFPQLIEQVQGESKAAL